MYLPEGWHLVACDMSTTIPGIISEGFDGRKIILLDGSSILITFLQNMLEENNGESYG